MGSEVYESGEVGLCGSELVNVPYALVSGKPASSDVVAVTLSV